MALPRSAPPSTSIAFDVVSVNSSMLARVPGPAEREAIEATISPYSTRVVARRTAYTIGMVAWPPQVTMLTLGSSMVASPLITGMVNGPIAAGVRSMIFLSSRCSKALLRIWACAEVASNTTRMSR